MCVPVAFEVVDDQSYESVGNEVNTKRPEMLSIAEHFRFLKHIEPQGSVRLEPAVIDGFVPGFAAGSNLLRRQHLEAVVAGTVNRINAGLRRRQA